MDTDTEELVALQTLVPPPLAERVRRAAEADDRPVSAWIRRLLVRELDGNGAPA
jgi:hypothetical protein